MQNTTATNNRVQWVDYGKGIGILGVVLVHVVSGMISADIITNETVKSLFQSYLQSSFVMPIFFFLAGLFISRSVKKPLNQFFWARVRTILYPYFIWFFVTYIIHVAMSSYTNHPVTFSWSVIGSFLTNPSNHYWFFYGIFLTVMTFMLMAKAGLDMRWFLALTIGLTILGLLVDLSAHYAFDRLTRYAIFFALGIYFSQRVRDAAARIQLPTLGLMSFASLLIWGAVIVAGLDALPEWCYFFVRALGLFGGLGVCILMGRLEVFGFINTWGRLSLEIYVSHVIFASGFRIILQRFLGVEDPVIHFVAGMVVGVAFPLLLYWFTKQINFNYLYTWPKESKPAVVTRSTA